MQDVLNATDRIMSTPNATTRPVMQDVLNVTDRVVSTSDATTSPCGQLLTLCNQTDPSDEQLSGTVDTNATAVIASTAHTDSKVFAFSADQATGQGCVTSTARAAGHLPMDWSPSL